MQNSHRSSFQIDIAHTGSSQSSFDGVRVSLEADSTSAAGNKPTEVDLWMPHLAPSPDLSNSFRSGSCDWYEFQRRYSLQLQSGADDCEQLRHLACKAGIVLLHCCPDPERNIAVALKHHVEQLECQRRWKSGLMIGGYLYPLLDEVVRSGGLWFARHKAWMMPDREAWERIQSLLPGDF